jgi:hypothetical protein
MAGENPSGEGSPTRVVEGDESYDVSPVADPGPLVVHVRWKNPSATLDTAARVMRLPSAFINANLHLAVQESVQELLGDKVEAKAFAEVVELEAPIEFVLVADTSRGGPVPEPIHAVSVGLSSIGRARDAAKGRPHKIAAGLWRVGPPPQPWEDVCAIAASSGKSPGRLICTSGERELARIAPYVARNVPTLADPPSDVRAEVNFRPLFDKYGRQWITQVRGLPVIAEELKNGIPSFDDALMDAATALATEAGALISDADKIVVDATVNESEGVLISGKVSFLGKKSWLVQTVVDGANLAGPAPDIFWQLPASSETVNYSRAGDPARFDDILEVSRRLVEGALEKEKIGTQGDRKAISKLLRFPVKKGAPYVVASGHFATAPKGNVMQDVLDATLGWQLFGIEDGPAAIKSYLDDAVAAYNRGGLQAYLKKEMGSDAKNLPIVKKGGAPGGLGGAASGIEIRIPNLDDPTAVMMTPPGRGAPPKAKTTDVTIHVVLMPDGQRTWVGIGSDANALAQLMKGLKGPKPGADSISSRAELAMFKSGRHMSGGFTTLDGLFGSVRPMLSMMSRMGGAGMSEMAQVNQVLARMPNKGKTPITMFTDVGAGGRPSLTFSGRVGRDTLIDVGFLLHEAEKIANKR